MLNYIAAYQNPYEKDFNNQILMSVEDTSIVDFIIMEMQELEAVGNYTIEKIEVVEDCDEVNINDHMVNINFKKKNMDDIEIPKYKPIADGVYGEIRFTIRVETNLNSKTILKRILFPIERDGYYLNAGRKMKAIWQLTDAGTYSQRGKNTLKSRMPVIIYQNKKRVIMDIDENEYTCSSYSYALNGKAKFGTKKAKAKFINPLMIYAAKMGMSNTIEFFGMKNIVFIEETVTGEEPDSMLIFKLNDVYIKVDKYLFDKYDLVRSFVCMLYNLSSPKDFPVNMNIMEDKVYWICRIGTVGVARNKNLLSFYEKGVTNILMIERLLNKVTQEVLRLPYHYKQNIYYIIYWMITNFEELRKYSNTDMHNKRIRKNEYIVNSSLGRKISDNINKLIERKGKSKMNTMDTLLEVFNFGSDIVVAGMRKLNDLLKSDDLSNDMTILQEMAFSNKGPQSMAAENSKMVANKYRFLDPSMIGILDLNVSPNSDVGMSGSFTPFTKIYDRFFFDDEQQPCMNRYLFDKSLVEDMHLVLPVDVSSFEKYLSCLDDGNKFLELLKPEPIEIIEKEPTKK